MRKIVGIAIGFMLIFSSLSFAAGIEIGGVVLGGYRQGRPLVTGQDTPYSSMDDDGQLQKGVARSYTALTTGQYAGTTNITVNAKTIAMENQCVQDNQTGLMWMKYTPDSDIGPDTNGTLYWVDSTNHEDVFTFCDQANSESLSGYTDWRVPNVFELFSIIVEDAGIGASFIDTTYFQCVSSYYWSSTTYPDDTTRALLVRFDYGHVSYSPKATGKLFVRLVRG